MERSQQLIPKPGGVEQIDSDDDMYDNPDHDQVASLNSNEDGSQQSQGGNSNKASDITNKTAFTSHLNSSHHRFITTPNALELNSDDNLDESVSAYNKSLKYSIIQSRDDNILSNTNPYHGDSTNIIKIHNLNLNDRKQRLVALSIILFIWCVPTLILSINIYQDDENQNDEFIKASNTNNKTQIISMVILLIAIVFLLGFELINFRHSIINWIIGLLFISGGIIHFIGSIIYANKHCHNSKHTTHIDNNTGYCYLGYISSSDLAFYLPLILGIDVIFSILNNKHVRIIILSFIICLSTFCTVIVLSKYGNGFGLDFPGIYFEMDHKLYITMTMGWWMLCICKYQCQLSDEIDLFEILQENVKIIQSQEH